MGSLMMPSVRILHNLNKFDSAEKLALHSCLGADRKHKTLGSETKGFIICCEISNGSSSIVAPVLLSLTTKRTRRSLHTQWGCTTKKEL